jgi:uncharacterized DUF497 family protein
MYEWDETKRAKNLANYGLDFALIEAFDWEQAIMEKDETPGLCGRAIQGAWLHR